MKKRRQARLSSDDADEGADDWLLTYGDLMTQLVCFFVLLMSFSIVSSMKFREVVVSLHDALDGNGVLSAWMSTVDDLPRNIDVENEALMELKAEIEGSIAENGMSEYVETEIRKDGLFITLIQKDPAVFFDTGDAKIKEEAYSILNEIGRIIKELPNDIRIEGHTDNRPINTSQFPSNWELSTVRATNVLRYLNKIVGIAPDRLSAAGYGFYRPIASNDTYVGMSKNRRVEIVILHKQIIEDD